MNEEQILNILFEFVPADSISFDDMDLRLWQREVIGDNKIIHEWPIKITNEVRS